MFRASYFQHGLYGGHAAVDEYVVGVGGDDFDVVVLVEEVLPAVRLLPDAAGVRDALPLAEDVVLPPGGVANGIAVRLAAATVGR